MKKKELKNLTDNIIIRVTPKQKQAFKAACDLMGLTQSELLREAIETTPKVAPLFAAGAQPVVLNDPTGKIQ